MNIEELPLEQRILLIVYQSEYPVKSGYIYEKLKGQKVTREDFERVMNKLYDLGMLDTVWERKDGHSIRLIELTPTVIPIAKDIEKSLKVRKPVLVDPKILDFDGEYSYEDRQTYLGHMKMEGKWGFKNIFIGTEFWADAKQYVACIAIPQYCSEIDNVVKEIEAIMHGIKPVDGKRRIVVFYDEMYDAPQIVFDEETKQYGISSESYCSRKEEESKLHDLTEIVEYISNHYPDGVDRTSREPFTFTGRISVDNFKSMTIFEIQNAKGDNMLEELENRFGDEEIEVTVRRK